MEGFSRRSRLIVKTLLTTLVLSLLAGPANANAKQQRVLVKLKSQELFQTLTQAQAEKSNDNWGAGSKGLMNHSEIQKIFPKTKVNIQAHLEHLNSMVMTIDSKTDLELLRKNPNVEFADVEVFYPAPKPVLGAIYTPLIPDEDSRGAAVSQTPWGIVMVRAFGAWALGGMGQGTRVLVLDTGIDKNHPAVKANFEEGKNFIGDATLVGEPGAQYPVYGPVNPAKFADTEGHGTHVAGTIAASLFANGFSGVAPQSKYLMGRVCSPYGCSNISVAQGINWGIEKKVDVISMSLGGPWATPSERFAVVRAYAAGITLVAATGNDEKNTVSYPAALSQVIAVGAVDSTGTHAKFSQWGPEVAITAPGVDVISSVPVGTGRIARSQVSIGASAMSFIRSSVFQGSKAALTPEENDLVHVGLGKAEDFARASVSGKFALIQRGEITFKEKVANAIAAGAVGAVIYNHEDGLVNGVAADAGVTLPISIFGVEKKVGESLVQALQSGQTARARLYVQVTDYMSFNGTSMATPHVSGVIALMKSVNRSLTPSQIKAIIQKTAYAIADNPENRYGAGIINAEAAVQESMLTPVFAEQPPAAKPEVPRPPPVFIPPQEAHPRP